MYESYSIGLPPYLRMIKIEPTLPCAANTFGLRIIVLSRPQVDSPVRVESRFVYDGGARNPLNTYEQLARPILLLSAF